MLWQRNYAHKNILTAICGFSSVRPFIYTEVIES